MVLKTIFGGTFNIFDVIVLLILGGYGYYIYVSQGFGGFFEMAGNAIFTALVVSIVASWIIKKARK